MTKCDCEWHILAQHKDDHVLGNLMPNIVKLVGICRVEDGNYLIIDYHPTVEVFTI
jgi:hypothetical protein